MTTEARREKGSTTGSGVTTNLPKVSGDATSSRTGAGTDPAISRRTDVARKCDLCPLEATVYWLGPVTRRVYWRCDAHRAADEKLCDSVGAPLPTWREVARDAGQLVALVAVVVGFLMAPGCSVDGPEARGAVTAIGVIGLSVVLVFSIGAALRRISK